MWKTQMCSNASCKRGMEGRQENLQVTSTSNVTAEKRNPAWYNCKAEVQLSVFSRHRIKKG